MDNLSAQTVIARHKCPDCGGKVFVKVNKNGNAYFNCTHEIEKTGNKCAGQRRYGRDISQSLKQRFFDNEGVVFDMVKKKEPRPEPKNLIGGRQTVIPKDESLSIPEKIDALDDLGGFLNDL